MPRKPRFYVPGVPVHVVQRGNNRQAIFFEDNDYQAYLSWLKEGAERYLCSIHAWVLMTNHVHLLVTPTDQDSISRMMQFVGRRYVPYINHTYRRTGTLWEGRYKSHLISDETWLLVCYRYIELNPVRAAMVESPTEYRWSSYKANALGELDALIRPHPRYLELGIDKHERCQAYRALFRHHLDDEKLHDLRSSLQTLMVRSFRAEVLKNVEPGASKSLARS